MINTFSEQATDKIVEQVKWGMNYPRSMPQQDDSSYSQTTLACFTLTTTFTKHDDEHEYRAQGKIVLWGGSQLGGQYAVQSTPQAFQWLYNPTGQKDSSGNALWLSQYQPFDPGQRVWAVFRGRWEIIPDPLPLYVTIGPGTGLTVCDSTTGYFDGVYLSVFLNGQQYNLSHSSGPGCKVKSVWQSGGYDYNAGAIAPSFQFGLLINRMYKVLDVIGWDTSDSIPIVLVDPGQQIFIASAHNDMSNWDNAIQTYDLSSPISSAQKINAWTVSSLNTDFTFSDDPIIPAGTRVYILEAHPGDFYALLTPGWPVLYTPQNQAESFPPDGKVLRALSFQQPIYDNNDTTGEPRVGFASIMFGDANLSLTFTPPMALGGQGQLAVVHHGVDGVITTFPITFNQGIAAS